MTDNWSYVYRTQHGWIAVLGARKPLTYDVPLVPEAAPATTLAAELRVLADKIDRDVREAWAVDKHLGRVQEPNQ